MSNRLNFTNILPISYDNCDYNQGAEYIQFYEVTFENDWGPFESGHFFPVIVFYINKGKLETYITGDRPVHEIKVELIPVKEN